MKEFTNIINVNNKKNFPDVLFNRVICYLRRDIYEHIISQEENNYFDLDVFRIKHKLDKQKILKMVETLVKELTDLNWKCKLSFGSTALFIYSTQKPPPSCWDDGL